MHLTVIVLSLKLHPLQYALTSLVCCLQNGQEQQTPKVRIDDQTACKKHHLAVAMHVLKGRLQATCTGCVTCGCPFAIQDLVMKTVGALTAAQLALLPLSGEQLASF